MNVILPGVTDTDGVVMPPLGLLGQPVDVARAVAFLAGPDAAWVTGQLGASCHVAIILAFDHCSHLANVLHCPS